MHDVMVDIETTGTLPDRAAILQIAAVRFDLETGDVDTNFFDECLHMPPWRSWDQSTAEWWGRQKRSVLDGILVRARNPRDVMNEFVDWVGYDTAARFWAKPLSFDFPFISSYCHDFGLKNPFDFRTAMDCRSYLAGYYYPTAPVSEKDIPFDGDVHNALFDVLHQIKWILHNQKAMVINAA